MWHLGYVRCVEWTPDEGLGKWNSTRGLNYLPGLLRHGSLCSISFCLCTASEWRCFVDQKHCSIRARQSSRAIMCARLTIKLDFILQSDVCRDTQFSMDKTVRIRNALCSYCCSFFMHLPSVMIRQYGPQIYTLIGPTVIVNTSQCFTRLLYMWVMCLF